MITLDQLYAGGGELEQAGAGAATTVELVDSLDLANYTPSPGANYPSTGTGATLSKQAQIIANVAKHGAGLQVATLDFGGWDTHENEGAGDQGNLNSNQYAAHVDGLSQVLTALYNDLAGDGLADRMIVVVQSEFGRRVRENASHGTDHGSGNPMLVLGGRVAGGRLHGTFGGLPDGQLFQNEDVATTTDTRLILSEIVTSTSATMISPRCFRATAIPAHWAYSRAIPFSRTASTEPRSIGFRNPRCSRDAC